MSGTLSKRETLFWGVLVAILLGALAAVGVRNISMSDREYQLRCTIGESQSMSSEWGSSLPYLDDGAAWSLPDGGFYRMKEGEACKPVYRTPSR